MQNRTINNALLALRRQIIRENGEGQDHVETLLELRSVPIPKPCAYRGAFKPKEVKRAILSALSDGPKSGPELYRHVMGMRDGLTYADARVRASSALTRLKKAGLVRREGGVWLAP